MRIQSAAVFVIAMVPVMAAAQQFLPVTGPSVDPNARYEVVAIKPASDSGPVRMRMTPGGLESTSVPIGLLLRRALQKSDYQIVGAPGWMDSERYSIRATALPQVSRRRR